jgi:hypothetical protein
MTQLKTQFGILALLPCLFAGCGTGVGYGISATASFLNGPTPTASSFTAQFERARAEEPNLAQPRDRSPSQGTWYLTPDRMTLTVISIAFIPVGGGSAFNSSSSVNCTVTYDKSQATLSSLGDCPFQVPAGTYGGIQIQVSTMIQFTVNDTANGFYTDPTAPHLITDTPPSGGAQSVSFNQAAGCTQCGSGSNIATFQTGFASPITVSDSSHPKVFVVFDPVHWVTVPVSLGGVSGDLSVAGTGIPLIPSISPVSSVEYYSNVGTLGSFNLGSVGQATGIKIYSTSAGPARADMIYGVPASNDGIAADSGCAQNMGNSAWPANPKDSTPGLPGSDAFFGSGGYLGVDSSSNLSWAFPTDFSYSSYAAVFSLPRVTGIGQSTTLSYECTSDVPAPSSGDTYSSGAPSFSASATRSLTLLTR